MASETAPASPPTEAPAVAPAAPTETAPVATPPPGAAPAETTAGTEAPAKVEPPAAAPTTPPELQRQPAASAVAKLMKERAKVRGTAAQLTESQKKLQEQQQALEKRGQELSQVAELKELLAKDPVEAAKRLAGSEEELQGFLQKLTDAIVSDGQGKPAGLSKEDRAQLEQVKSLQEKISQLEKANADREAQLVQERSRLEAQELEYRANQYLDAGWKECAKATEEYELVMATEGYRARVEQRVIQNGTKAAEEAKALGKKPAPLTSQDFLAAAREVQAELEKELEPVLSTKRIRSRFAPAAAPGTPAPAEQPAQPKTLTTERGDPAVSPDWANMSVADRLYHFQKGIKPRTGGVN